MASSAFGFSFPQYSSESHFSFATFKKFNTISPAVQNHLKRVYLTLACSLVSAAVGVYLHLLWSIGGFLTAIAGIGAIYWLFLLPPLPVNEGTRLKLFMAAALLNGATLGPLVELVVGFDPSILVSAIVGTVLIFVCFSASAVMAQRREYLFLGGFLASGLSVLVWLQFASSLFGASVSVYMFEIYFGLVVFLGYIIFDTQMIIEKAHLGDSDYVTHALDLFTSFLAVFGRILMILTKNAAEKSEKKKKKRND